MQHMSLNKFFSNYHLIYDNICRLEPRESVFVLSASCYLCVQNILLLFAPRTATSCVRSTFAIHPNPIKPLSKHKRQAHGTTVPIQTHLNVIWVLVALTTQNSIFIYSERFCWLAVYLPLLLVVLFLLLLLFFGWRPLIRIGTVCAVHVTSFIMWRILQH